MFTSAEAKQGRTIVARFKPGQDLFKAINKLLRHHKVKSGYIPVLQGGFKNLKIISMTYGKSEDNPQDIEVEYRQPLEYFGTGTVASVDNKPSIHIHLTAAQAGNKSITGHLVSGEIVLLTEIVIVELLGVEITRKFDKDVFNYKLLDFN